MRSDHDGSNTDLNAAAMWRRRARVVARHTRQRIERDGMVEVGRVDVAELFNAMRREAIEDAVDRLAVRIDHHHAVTLLDVVEREVGLQRRLAAARTADDVDVALPLFRGQRQRRGVNFMTKGCDIHTSGRS